MKLTISVASGAAVNRNVYVAPINYSAYAGLVRIERGDSYGIQNDADSRQGY